MKKSSFPFLERPYLIAFIVFLIMTIIGLLIIIFASSPPQLLSLGEVLSIGGMIGSWGTMALGATRGLVMDFRDEMAEFRSEMAEFRKETITLLTEIRDSLRGR